MQRSWWWKTAGFLILTLLSCVYLVPTLVPSEQLPEWFKAHFNKKIQPGLDLQGGLHLVYSVDVAKAVKDKADRIASDIEDKLKNDKKVSGVTAEPNDSDIVVRFAKVEDLAKIDRDFFLDYRNQLAEVSRDPAKGEVRYTIDANYIDNIKEIAVKQGRQIVERRINEKGVTEPNIAVKGQNIVIELPGLKEEDFEKIKKLIARTAQLEFKIVDDSDPANEYMAELTSLVPKDSGIQSDRQSWTEKADTSGAHQLVFFTAKSRDALEKFFASVVAEKPLPSGTEIGYEEIKPRGGEMGLEEASAKDVVWNAYLLKKRAELTGEFLTEADIGMDNSNPSAMNMPIVRVTFDREGTAIIERLSSANIGRRMAIILDNKIESAPTIQSRLGSNIQITLGGYNPNVVMEEAKELVAVLRSGSLPAPLEKTFETKVGPTLGRDAVNKAKFSMMVGSLAVVLFMLIYYRRSGFIADVAMVLNILFMVAILAGLEATLTLPGIAGLVLTVGMAVDANIIIYERIREELRAGKSPRAAVDAGFARAFWTVFDAHVTNLVAGVVLLSYGSGPIRGFAVTLLIGIITNLFTSVWVSRGMFALMVDRKKPVQVLSI